MGMAMSPASSPSVRGNSAEAPFVTASASVHRSHGTASSFMCSQVDSLTAAKAAATGLPPLQP